MFKSFQTGAIHFPARCLITAKGAAIFTPADDSAKNPDGTLKAAKCYAGCDERELMLAPCRLAPRNRRTEYRPVSLAELADAKRLDAEKLMAQHVREIPAGHTPEAHNGGIENPLSHARGRTARNPVPPDAGGGRRSTPLQVAQWRYADSLRTVATGRVVRRRHPLTM